MKKLGYWLIIFSVGSAVLHSFGYEFKILMWVDMWGANIGWAIRGGLVVVGAGLWIFGNRTESVPASTSA